MKYSHHKSSAFSLIELLVSVTIILLLVGSALAGYIRYIDKQRLVAAAEKIQSGFREAQNMAKIGYLGDCDELDRVDFSFSIDGGEPIYPLTYQITVYCVGNVANKYFPQVTIDTDFSLTPGGASLSFYPYGNLSGIVSRTLCSTRSSYCATFDIDQGGGIKVTYN